MSTAWTYLVVSTGPQEYTLDDQRGWAEECAARNGWEITREFSGRGSGADGTRDILLELISELEQMPKRGRPERVLMIRLDRIGRIALDGIGSLAKIRSLGVTLHTRTDGDVPLDSVYDILKPIVELFGAETENRGRRDKMRAAHARFRAAGWHFGPAPYGMTKDEQKRLIPLEPQASFVLRAFELRATGAGFIRIASEIGRDAPSQGTYAGRPRGNLWHRHTVEWMLRCPSYRGLVVPEALFDAVQEIKNPDFKQRATQKYPWPLQGSIKCWCGWTLVGGLGAGTRGKPDSRRRYYSCVHPNFHARAGEKRPSVPAAALEEQFVAWLGELRARPELVLRYQARTAQVDASAIRRVLRADRAQLQVVERRRAAAYDLQADGQLPAADLRRRIADLQAERDEVTARISKAERTLRESALERSERRDAALLLARAAELWGSAPVAQQKELTRLLTLAAGGMAIDRDRRLTTAADAQPPRQVRARSSTISFAKLTDALGASLNVSRESKSERSLRG